MPVNMTMVIVKAKPTLFKYNQKFYFCMYNNPQLISMQSENLATNSKVTSIKLYLTIYKLKTLLKTNFDLPTGIHVDSVLVI